MGGLAHDHSSERARSPGFGPESASHSSVLDETRCHGHFSAPRTIWAPNGAAPNFVKDRALQGRFRPMLGPPSSDCKPMFPNPLNNPPQQLAQSCHPRCSQALPRWSSILLFFERRSGPTGPRKQSHRVRNIADPHTRPYVCMSESQSLEAVPRRMRNGMADTLLCKTKLHAVLEVCLYTSWVCPSVAVACWCAMLVVCRCSRA